MSLYDEESTIPEFEAVIDLLRQEDQPFPPSLWNQFSDISRVELNALKRKWTEVRPERKTALLEDLESMMDYNFQVNFDEFAKFCMDDDEPAVRAGAIRLLFEYDRRDLVDKMLDVLENDADELVQSTAATMLGNYVYLGELEEFPAEEAHRIEDALLRAIDESNSVLVQRRALEAVSFSGREEVSPLILAAYEKNERDWILTALYAMGRSASQEWGKIVMQNLDHYDTDIQFEAIQAAGEMYLETARPWLLKTARDAENLDQSIRMAIARALENIGGDGVMEALESLMEWADDDEEMELLEQAVEFTAFTGSVRMPSMFGFSGETFEEAIHEIEGDDIDADDMRNYLREEFGYMLDDDGEYVEDENFDRDDEDLFHDHDHSMDDDDDLDDSPRQSSRKRHRH
ncbi:MAG: HEAT repeat domain-containing protein [Anaerolineae bacterium]|nr:HEAT repeat domain-containing protein [Anaerolineae bacterium]